METSQQVLIFPPYQMAKLPLKILKKLYLLWYLSREIKNNNTYNNNIYVSNHIPLSMISLFLTHATHSEIVCKNTMTLVAYIPEQCAQIPVEIFIISEKCEIYVNLYWYYIFMYIPLWLEMWDCWHILVYTCNKIKKTYVSTSSKISL